MITNSCNNCDTEATHFYLTDKGATFFLCEACHDAFELGQVNADKDTTVIGDEDPDKGRRWEDRVGFGNDGK